MFWRQFEMIPLGLASKLGFHPLTTTSSPPKWPPIGPQQLKIGEFVMHLLDYAFYMHCRQFEMLWLSRALKLGIHPLTKAISTSPQK
jgi:hypothetical protein